jgi:hypothetical protein
MANPTTNYGFVMPSPTDLVTDLPADFEVFGQAVDTQMLTNANAAIAKTIVDAKGDIIAATAADTVSRLAVGANNTVLTADSAEATGMKWAAPAAGGMTLLSTTTLSGASTTISSIDQTYVDLQVVIYGTTNASANYYPYFKPNNSGNVADFGQLNNSNGSPVNQANVNGDFAMNYGLRSQTDANNFFTITINNYASTVIKKNFISSGAQINSSSQQETILTQGLFDTASAITSITISASSGTYNAGTVLIYGVK